MKKPAQSNANSLYILFNDYCRSLRSTTHVVQWGGSHVWKVGGKVFAIGGWVKGDEPAFTFKTSDSDFLFLSEESGYRPAPYFANRGMKWIQKHGVSDMDDALMHFLKKSHHIVSLGLTKKKQKELGLNQN